MTAGKIIYKDECYDIQGAIYDVYHEMGSGFLENVYQECLEKEFKRRNIPFQSQKELILHYKGEQLKQFYIADLVGYNKIIIELKVVKKITPIHRAQVINYLKATGSKLGLLVNFGDSEKATVERIVL